MHESLLEFPCQVPVKAMGLWNADFDALVVGIIRRHVGDIVEGAVRSRLSRRGKYVAVTVTVTVNSSEQLECIYRDLGAHQQVVMTL
jgi:putative lipoic acid-binding regulatory protein